MTSTAPQRTPSFAVRQAIALTLLVVTFCAGVIGLVRYVGSLEHRRGAMDALVESGEGLVQKVAEVTAMDWQSEATSFAALTLVEPGKEDAFGIARGASVSVDIVRDARAQPPDPEAFQRLMMQRSAEMASQAGEPRREVLPAAEGGTIFLSVYLPIGDTGAMLRVVQLEPPAPVVVPSWLLLLLTVLAALVGGLFGGRADAKTWWFAVVGALFAALCGMTRSPDAAFGAALGAFVWVWVTYRGLCELIRGLREQPATYLYVAPAVVSTFALVFVPFAMGIGLAFFNAQGEPVGLGNFSEILIPSETSDTRFWYTLGMTVLWTATNIILHVSIGLGLALILNRDDLEFKWLYRILLVIPWAVPNYITALIWKGMFNEHAGAVNALLAAFGLSAVDWFGTSVVTNFLANLITNVWLGFPFMMVVSLGALQAIPKELYEAARIDGAGRLAMFRHVTLPLLKPALIPAVILGTIWTFNMFNVIYLVSGGGPDGQTDILITEAYRAFKVLKRYGLAAAYALIIFAVLYLYGAMTDRVTNASKGAFE